MDTKKRYSPNEEKEIWDKIWHVIWWFFAVTIVFGGFMLAYFGDRDEVKYIMENPQLKGALFIFGAIGSCFILYAEVRKRTKTFALKRVLYTAIACVVIFVILAVTRL